MKTFLLLTAFLLLSACQQGGNEQSLLEEKQNDPKFKYVSDSDPIEKKTMTREEAAEHLAGLAVQVPDVHDATAVVLGDYVAVGIDVDKDLDRSRVGVIKYSVAEALKNDPYGKQAAVFADADVVERLRGLGDKIAQGHPVDALTDELSQIVARYMPEGPVNEEPKSNNNQDSIPEEEQKNLDQVENEQSYSD
ncbi:YhcN/YlaJ family sporulation lipoprotein [Halobacillus litoralis]|uniref:YhcN/YlaJ family sporulation lipoprotein n=1 Tax=Halobacillus litoralis TaxID=45668 RepID=UPI001369119B|nr:YhcN/YlaJ family sporulation lipoprotein [Halobacillus litoralis]MCA1023412.1 YhcN/YlaJ family sporulation lipoprotein [Halobacillus litoralis]MYL37871.1 YhcN/YlaJ family sporulation lipoprotein [Halobacillus litoralis]